MFLFPCIFRIGSCIWKKKDICKWLRKTMNHITRYLKKCFNLVGFGWFLEASATFEIEVSVFHRVGTQQRYRKTTTEAGAKPSSWETSAGQCLGPISQNPHEKADTWGIKKSSLVLAGFYMLYINKWIKVHIRNLKPLNRLIPSTHKGQRHGIQIRCLQAHRSGSHFQLLAPSVAMTS